jgi:hypothetical protein
MTQDLFIVKTMNEWLEEAANSPAPKMLFGDFWLEGELAVLFSDAGRGKSLLGVQVAESIARGRPIGPVPMTAKPRKVLYFDFEFSAKQFEMRYSDDARDTYRFPKNFHRVELGLPRDIPEEYKTYEEYLLASIGDTIRASRAKMIVIDSMAWLQGPNITARHTVPLMRELKRLTSTLGLSILVLAHNPRRDTSRPLTISGLHGAGVICNFADSVFAIAQSRIDSSFRYIKHIKSRSTELVCDETNVLVGEIRKWEKNFLSLRFHRYSPESHHLVKEINPLLEERARMIREMSEERGMTQREIAAQLGISLGSVNRYLQMTREDDDYFDLDDGFYLDDDDGEDKPNESVPPAVAGGSTSELSEPARVSSPHVSKGAEPAEPARVSSPTTSKGAKSAEPARVSSPRASKGAKSAEPARVSSPHVSKGAELGQLGQLDGVGSPHASKGAELNEPGPPPYKTLDDKIEVGDIVQDRNGQLMKKTFWGWDRCGL